MRIQIGNLDESVEDRTLARLFARHGAVLDARVATHWETGRSTGVGFVEMESDRAGDTAIAALHGRLHRGRVLSVCWSTQDPMPPQPGDDMFGPMNVIETARVPTKPPEHRGLPSEE
jgi:RNA recognition motif-containing protein